MSRRKPCSHRVFERVGLDDPDALHGLLHGFEDARAAGELALGDAGDAPDHLAQEVERRRHHDEAEERHHRVLHDHHDQQGDEHEQVAADGPDDEVDGCAGGRGSGGEARKQFGRVPVGEEVEILVDQRVEHSPLVVGDDRVADLRKLHRLQVGRARLDHEDHGGDEADDQDAVEVLVHVGLVDHVADEVGAERGAAGGEQHQAERPEIALPLPRRLFDHQPAHQRGRAVRIGEKRLKIRFEHSRSVLQAMRSRQDGVVLRRVVLAQPDRQFKWNRAAGAVQRRCAASLRSHASACVTMVARSSNCGCHFRTSRECGRRRPRSAPDRPAVDRRTSP